MNCKLIRNYIASCSKVLGGCLPFVVLVVAHIFLAVLNLMASDCVRRMIQDSRSKFNFIIVTGVLVLCGSLTSVLTASLVGRAGQRIHSQMLRKVMYAKIEFYD